MKRSNVYAIFGGGLILVTLVAGGLFVQRAHSAAAQERNAALARTGALRAVTPPKSIEPVHLANPEAETAFQAGLKEYQRANYLGAITGFYSATKIDPTESAPHFLLGVCYLLTNDTRPAISELRLVTNLKESQFVEAAHYFLAKAYLRQGDDQDAARELDTLIASGGEALKGEALQLKTALDSN